MNNFLRKHLRICQTTASSKQNTASLRRYNEHHHWRIMQLRPKRKRKKNKKRQINWFHMDFFKNLFGQKLTEIYPILINKSIYNICNFFFDHFGFLLYITINKND